MRESSAQPVAVLLLVAILSAGCAGARGEPATAGRLRGDRGTSPAAVDAGNRAGRRAVLDAIEETFEANLAEPDGPATEALARLRAQRDTLLAQDSATAFYDALNAILREGGNPHLHVYRPGRDLFDQETADRWIVGATLRRVDGYSFVDDIWEGGPAEEAGLIYGDELLPVGDRQPMLDPLPAGTRRVRLWIRRTRESEPFFLDVEAVQGDTVWYLAESTRSSIRTVDHGGCKVGIIHLRTFADEDLTDELVTGAHFDNADGLVLDLRGNRGGEVRLAGEIFDLLSRRRSLWIHYHNNVYSFPPTSWNRPLVILVDGETYSAAEIFASAAQVLDLATVVGTRTAGRVQASRVFPLPGGARLMLPVSRVTLPDGSDLEERGVIPDLPVERPLMYAAGADPPMERALALLRQQLACPEELPPERFPQEKVTPAGDVP